jgi:ABC-type phosphate/phosphonate transport system ATPase subunit
MFLADEPVSNLDPDLTFRVLQILRAQTRQESRTVVCVLHDPELVERFADLVITLNPAQPQEWTLRAARAGRDNAAARP